MAAQISVNSDAVELMGDPEAGPWVITVEHASRRVPAPLRTTARDRLLLGSHHGVDIGARAVTAELTRRAGGSAVLARFSRLVVDANRPEGHPDMARAVVEGSTLTFNRAVDPAELERRMSAYHRPFHHAVDRVLEARGARPGAFALVALHSFTPVWEHRLRPLDVGILYDAHDDLAQWVLSRLRAVGLTALANQPYDARLGLAHSCHVHGRRHGVPYFEIELNQALISSTARARRVARVLTRALAPLVSRLEKRLEIRP